MPVVAEGIEDRTAMAHLLERGCEYWQGFLFSKAVRADEAKRMLQVRHSGPRAVSGLAAMHERIRGEFVDLAPAGDAVRPEARAVA